MLVAWIPTVTPISHWHCTCRSKSWTPQRSLRRRFFHLHLPKSDSNAQNILRFTIIYMYSILLYSIFLAEICRDAFLRVLWQILLTVFICVPLFSSSDAFSKVADFGPVPHRPTLLVPSNGGDEVMQAALQGLEQRQSRCEEWDVACVFQNQLASLGFNLGSHPARILEDTNCPLVI